MVDINLRALLLTRDRQAGPELCKYLFHIKPVNGTNDTVSYLSLRHQYLSGNVLKSLKTNNVNSLKKIL